MKSLVGCGMALTFVCGWNISFLLYDAFRSSSSSTSSSHSTPESSTTDSVAESTTHSRNPFSEYDDLVGLVAVCEILVNTYLAALQRHRLWSLRRLVLCLMLPSLCLCPVGAWVYAASDITTVRVLIAHLLFWFAFGWFCLHLQNEQRRRTSGSAGEQNKSAEAPAGPGSRLDELDINTSKIAVSDVNGSSFSRAAALADVVTTDDSTGTVVRTPTSSSKCSRDHCEGDFSRLEENGLTTSTRASTTAEGAGTSEALERAARGAGARQHLEHVFDVDDGSRVDRRDAVDDYRDRKAETTEQSQEAAAAQRPSRPPSSPAGVYLKELDNVRSPEILFPRYVYLSVLCAASGAGFFAGLLGLSGPPLILLALLLPPSVYPASVARALLPLGLFFEPYARALYIQEHIDFRKYGYVYASAVAAGALGVWFGNRISAHISERIFRLILCGLLTGTSLVMLGIFEGNAVALAMLGLLVLVAGGMHAADLRRTCRASGATPRLGILGGGPCWRKNHDNVAP